MTHGARVSSAGAFGRRGPRRPTWILLAVALVLTLPSAFASQNQRGAMVDLVVRGDHVRGYHVRPAASGFVPGVVLIHEWWGLTDQIMGVADRLAGEGYQVIVPDLYGGKIPKDAGWARIYARDLDEGWAVDVIAAAADWLRAEDKSHAQRLPGQEMPVATWGMGLGGHLSLATALKGKDIQAAVMFYGPVVSGAEAVRPLGVPLLGIFGEDDHGVPRDQVKAFETDLKSEGKDATILIYRWVGAAFFNETRPGYSKDAAKLAWERALQFLHEKVGGPAVATPQEQTPRPEG